MVDIDINRPCCIYKKGKQHTDKAYHNKTNNRCVD